MRNTDTLCKEIIENNLWLVDADNGIVCSNMEIMNLKNGR